MKCLNNLNFTYRQRSSTNYALFGLKHSKAKFEFNPFEPRFKFPLFRSIDFAFFFKNFVKLRNVHIRSFFLTHKTHGQKFQQINYKRCFQAFFESSRVLTFLESTLPLRFPAAKLV